MNTLYYRPLLLTQCMVVIDNEHELNSDNFLTDI